MKIYRFSAFLTLIITLLLSSCQNNKTQVPTLSSTHKADSIRKDEINNPITHNYLKLAQRAVIRPIYVETERNVKSSHKGYLIHIKLHNLAKSVAYKDIKLEITYFSKEAIAIDKEEIRIKKAVKPSQILQISPKVLRYKNTSYKVKLVEATAMPA